MIQFEDISASGGQGILPDNLVWTPEIEKLNRFIVESVAMQCRGCAVMGQQCNGKSSAIRYLVRILSDELGYKVATVRWTMKALVRGAKRNERNFVQERMIQSECSSVSSRDVAVLWRRLLAHLVDMSAACGSRMMVVMIDEAQNLTLEEYNYLIYIYNGLEELGIKPFFMLVGQPDLANASASWSETNGLQVIGRFFTRTHRFQGITVNDVPLVLECFDERPSDDAPRVSAGLMPQIVDMDWHMGLWGPQFGEALKTLMVAHNLASGLRIPMQMLRSALLLLLIRVTSQRLDPRRVNSAMVMQALQETGFTSSLIYYAESDEPPRVSSGQLEEELA